MVDKFNQEFNLYQKFLDEIKPVILTEDEIFKHQYDWNRIIVSLALLDRWYGNRACDVLELGGEGVVTKILKSYFTEWKFSSTDFDLRSEEWYLDKCYDLILCMEVAEHLSDPDSKSSDYFNESFLYRGLDNCLRGASKALKNEGSLFLSTPNVSSNYNLLQTLEFKIPLQYLHHIREYTLAELVDAFKRCNLMVSKFECIEVLCVGWDFSILEEFYKRTKNALNLRGSNFFMSLQRGELGSANWSDIIALQSYS